MILVTGATGLIGRELVSLLLEAGEPVRALGRDPARLNELAVRGAQPLRAAVEDERTLRLAAAGCRLVYHAAGLVSHERRDQARLLETNGEAVRRLLEVTDPEARVVLVSSASTFGPAAAPGRAIDEAAQPPRWLFQSPYHASKLLGERYALEAVEAGRDVVVANPAFVVGAGQHRLGAVLRLYLRGLVRVLVPGGLSYVDVRDVVRGLRSAAERGRTGECYLLASRAANLSHDDFLGLVSRLAGRRRRRLVLPARLAAAPAAPLRWPLRRGEARELGRWWFYDQRKAERELAFSVRPLTETLTDLLVELGYDAG